MTASARSLVADGAGISAIYAALRGLQPRHQRQAVAPVAYRHSACF